MRGVNYNIPVWIQPLIFLLDFLLSFFQHFQQGIAQIQQVFFHKRIVADYLKKRKSDHPLNIHFLHVIQKNIKNAKYTRTLRPSKALPHHSLHQKNYEGSVF